MRTEQEMFDLILGIAKKDARIRAVYMNGSRTNPNAPKDAYQDYDIVYVVREFDSFTADNQWIDVFGHRFMLQMPEEMRFPSGDGHFTWMMLFSDGNRLDLTLIPIQKLELIDNDSLSIMLLDKDGILPQFSPPSNKDYILTPPSELFYMSCCNNFWWCLQNVAKGIARNELPYAMVMYNNVVRKELHDMVSWYIGTITDFSVSVGKMGKYFKKYLPPKIYKQYLKTYSDSEVNHIWEAVSAACNLFSQLALQVGHYFHYDYSGMDEKNMRAYLNNVKNRIYEHIGSEYAERKPLSEMTLQELWELFPIQLTEHKEYWEDWYREEQEFLSSFLPKNVLIYHIGSTAIKGIWAKPIVDILVEAPLKDHETIKELLLKNSYLCMAQSKKRMDFNKGYTPEGFAERVFHLHLRDFGDHDELYFRDYLNEHPEIAKDYEKLKLSLWKPFEHDRDGYTERKTEFVRKYTQRAVEQYGKGKYQ